MAQQIKYIDALNLIKHAADIGVLQYITDKNHVAIYHDAGKNSPEGWYSDNLDYAAKSLMNDKHGFDILSKAIREKEQETPEL